MITMYRMMDEVNEDMVNIKTLMTFKKDKVGLRIRMSLSSDQRANIPIRTVNNTAVLSGLSRKAYTDSRTDSNREKRFSAITKSRLLITSKYMVIVKKSLLIPQRTSNEQQR
jgi:hypothetical protein